MDTKATGASCVRLEKISITRFKGIDALNIDFSGRGAAISGPNGSGKTTIVDAFLWTLFGTDSSGASAFEIKPLDESGATRDPGAETSVEVTLSVDGKLRTLRRAYREIWTEHRGEAGRTLAGNRTDLSIDGVPLKAREYSQRVAEIVDAQRFRALTSVYAVARDLDWKSRRELLCQISGIASDADLARSSGFAQLAPMLDDNSIEELREMQLSARKKISGEKGKIPIQIQTLTAQEDTLKDVDYDALTEMRAALSVERDKITADVSGGEAVAGLRSHLAEVCASLDRLEQIDREFRTKKVAKFNAASDAKREAVKRDLAAAEADAVSARSALMIAEESRSKAESQLAALRKIWPASLRDSDLICPTCHQNLPAAKIAVMKQSIAADRKRLTDEAKVQTDALAEFSEKAEDCKKAFDAARAKVSEMYTKLHSLTSDVADPGHEDGYEEARAELEAEIKKTQDGISGYESDAAERNKLAIARRKELVDQLKSIDVKLAGRELIKNLDKSIADLRAQDKRYAQDLASADAMLEQLEQFERQKVRTVTDSVNAQFGLVRWKLFEEQINGGLRDCCEATIGGVPYSDLSNSEKIRAGIDIIHTLSGYFGQHVPLFVDNAESISSLPDAGTQTIRLIVSTGSKIEIAIDKE